MSDRFLEAMLRQLLRDPRKLCLPIHQRRVRKFGQKWEYTTETWYCWCLSFSLLHPHHYQRHIHGYLTLNLHSLTTRIVSRTSSRRASRESISQKSTGALNTSNTFFNWCAFLLMARLICFVLCYLGIKRILGDISHSPIAPNTKYMNVRRSC